MIYPFPSEVEVRDASGNLKCVTASEFYIDVHFHNLLEVRVYWLRRESMQSPKR